MDDRWWLVGVATLAPLTAALSLCSLLAFHAHRHRWRTLDLFLATLAAQELLVASLHFGRAVASLSSASGNISSTTGGGATCPLLVWASLSLRTFQVTTLTSAVLDRALALRWPYRYRLSVRRSQVRYHIVVLAVVSVLVGVASTFAKRESSSSSSAAAAASKNDADWKTVESSSSSVSSWTNSNGGGVDNEDGQPCFLLPFFLDKKFVVFVVFLHGLFTLISFVGVIHVTAKLSLGGRRSRATSASSAFHSISPSSLRVDHVRLPSMASASSSAGGGGGGGGGVAVTFHHRAAPPPLHSMQCLSAASEVVWSSPILRASCSSLRRSGTPSASLQARLIRRDFRWKTVALVVVVCNLVNHVPYLVMAVFGRWFDSVFEVSPSYLDGATTYLALLEGLLLPVVFWAVDPTYRAAVTNSFIRISRTGKSSTTAYFGSDRMEADNMSGIESLSCSTLPRRDMAGLLDHHHHHHHHHHHLPASAVSTYSSSAMNNSTLDKKVLLTDHVCNNATRRWTSLDEFDLRSPTMMMMKINAKDNNNLQGLIPTISTSEKKMVGNDPTSYDYDEKMKFLTATKITTTNNNNNNNDPSEEHIYATLVVNRLSMASDKDDVSKVARAATTDEDEPEMDNMDCNHNNNDDDDDDVDDDDDGDDDCSSFTTSASDDFEFHLTRPTDSDPFPKPLPAPVSARPNPQLFPSRTVPGSSSAQDVTPPDRFAASSRPSLQDIVWKATINNASSSSSPSQSSTMSIGSKKTHPQELGLHDIVPLAGVELPVISTKCVRSLSKNPIKRASLSMNDLDLLESPDDDDDDDDNADRRHQAEDEDDEEEATTTEEEIVYVLSGKSESTITLYRFRHDDAGQTLDRPLLRRSSSSSRWRRNDGNENLFSHKNKLNKHMNGGGHGRHHSHQNHHHHHHSANNVSSSSSRSTSSSFNSKRQYLRNPLLLRGRFTNRPRAPPAACDAIYGSNNWKYRPTVLPRQDFPWRKSPTQPFQAPQMPTSTITTTTTMVNVVDDAHPPSYRKTFISEFL